MEHDLLSTHQAGKFLGLSRRTLEKKRIDGSGPEYFRISSRCVRYAPEDLREWLNSLKKQNTYELGETT